jgi:hypothetical protein
MSERREGWEGQAVARSDGQGRSGVVRGGQGDQGRPGAVKGGQVVPWQI